MRARSGLIGRWEGPEVIRGSFLELKVAGPSMLGIGHPDRHALPRITLSKTHQPCRALPPARAGSFVGAQAPSEAQSLQYALLAQPSHLGFAEPEPGEDFGVVLAELG